MATATAYDGMGRPMARTVTQLSGRAYPGTASFRYDALGRLVEASDDDSTVTRTYDTLGNPVEESVQTGTSATLLRRTYDNRGRLATLDPPGDGNALSCARNADGLVTGISRHTTALAAYGYLGPRPVLRTLKNGAATVCGTEIGYEETGDRPAAITHRNADSDVVDQRTYTWDEAYNLTGWQITGWTPPTASATLGYDGLNRLAPPGGDWALDPAGNRTGANHYEFEGDDALMHRYTRVGTLARYYDPQGALVDARMAGDHRQSYHYDVDDRLDAFREVEVGTVAAFASLNLNDGDWTEISGTWEVKNDNAPGDPSEDYLMETSTSGAGAIVYAPADLPQYGFTVQYRSLHDPANPDGIPPPGAYDGDDYPAKFYAQIVLLVNMKEDAPDPYAALRIEPDRLVFVLCYDGQLLEVDGVQAETEPGKWYTVEFRHTVGGPGDNGSISVTRLGETSGDAVSMALNIPRDDPPGPMPIGFTVGEAAEYQFRLGKRAEEPDETQASVLWTHDALGRRVSETVCGAAGAVVSKTLYVWDGWRLVAELDARENNRVVAEYVPGPGYVDETVAVRRDLNRDGDFADANEGFLYPLADQQHSTVALLNASGNAVERYAYDAFGTPSFYDGAGNALAGGSAVGNTTLYTGRTWLPALGLYDYRQRLYDPATGRFLTPDPAQDPANLGNPYTYTANNPHAFVDPYGEDAIDLIVTGQWNPDDNTWQQAYGGFGLGASEGGIVVKNAATLGLNAGLNARASAIKADARARGDVLSQVGFGLGAVGVEAGYFAIGGVAMKGALASGRGTAFVIRHAVGMRYAAQAVAVASAAAGGYNLGSAVVSASEGDYEGTTRRLGGAVLWFAGAGSGLGAKAAPGNVGRGPLRIGWVEPPKNLKPGTTLFGDKMHERIGEMLQTRFRNLDKGRKAIYRLSQGQRGIDIEVPEKYVGRFGFRYSDIKPQSHSGAASLGRQIENWGFDHREVVPLTYRASGEVYIGF